jgi:hypothetical protein
MKVVVMILRFASIIFLAVTSAHAEQFTQLMGEREIDARRAVVNAQKSFLVYQTERSDDNLTQLIRSQTDASLALDAWEQVIQQGENFNDMVVPTSSATDIENERYFPSRQFRRLDGLRTVFANGSGARSGSVTNQLDGVIGEGFVVFKTTASLGSEDFDRHKIICEAFADSFADSEDFLGDDQFVTIWPVMTEEIASLVTTNQLGPDCSMAVEHYALSSAERVSSSAKLAGKKLAGRGPHLIAWANPGVRGVPNAEVLIVDLSYVETQRQAKENFTLWKNYIEKNPAMWRNGLDIERCRLAARHWALNTGRSILSVASLGGE